MSTATLTVTKAADPVVGSSSTGSSCEFQRPRWRRSKSSVSVAGRMRRHSIDLDADAVWIKVDLFITELERRLARLEEYGNLRVDAGITRAYNTLNAVRASCGSVSGELMDAGRRRAKVLVDILEPRYNDALAAKTSLEAKASAGMKLMEAFLTDLESRAHATYNEYPTFSRYLDKGWRRAESSLKHAKDAVDESFASAQEAAKHAKDTLKWSIDHAIALAKTRRLLNYEDLPVPWRVNPHITRGYRFSATKMECARSVFVFSNETINIWSHLLGFGFILALAFFSQLCVPYLFPFSEIPDRSYSFFENVFPAHSTSDYIFLGVFLFAAAKCLVCSTVWHTMSSIADLHTMERFACVDYTGISLLIAASIVSTEYAAFYCEPVSRWAYILLTLALGIAGSILPWHPTFNRADMSGLRCAFYISLGSTGLAPIVQLSYSHGWAWVLEFYTPLAKSLVCYLAGAAIYANKIPECFAPRGWFDYVGASHNIWHLAVLGGIYFHYSAMWQMFESAARRAAVGGCSVY